MSYIVEENEQNQEGPKGRGVTVVLTPEQAAQLDCMCEGTFRSSASMIRYLIHQEYCINYEPYIHDTLAPSTVG